MRFKYLVLFAGLGLLAGCAAPPQPVMSQAAPQGISYSAQVLSVRVISAQGPASQPVSQVMQALGAPNSVSAPSAQPQEVVVKLADGSVKSLVPPPGTAGLAAGSQVVITETPQLSIVPR